MTGPCLIADIGGTNVRFAVACGGCYDYKQDLKVVDYVDFSSAILYYQRNFLPGDIRPERAVLAVPGAIADGVVTPPNLNWTFSRPALQAELGLIEEPTLINDFAAIAMGVPHLNPSDRLEVGGGRSGTDGPIVIIGPGTGLGVASLIPVQGQWVPIASEGGHSTMMATNRKEGKILDWLREKNATSWGKHVSAERILSGAG